MAKQERTSAGEGVAQLVCSPGACSRGCSGLTCPCVSLYADGMTNRTFIEIVLGAAVTEVVDREEIEDALDEALQGAGLGEVTGGGTGLGMVHVNVELDATRSNEAADLIRRTLQGLGVPEGRCVQGPGTGEGHAPSP